MKRTMTAVDARKRFGELLESVYHGDDEVVIERAGKPMAVVVPVAVYESWDRKRTRFWDAIKAVHERNKDVPPEVIEQEVAEAVREVRAERRARRNAALTP